VCLTLGRVYSASTLYFSPLGDALLSCPFIGILRAELELLFTESVICEKCWAGGLANKSSPGIARDAIDIVDTAKENSDSPWSRARSMLWGRER
jgi:hypothetical protein